MKKNPDHLNGMKMSRDNEPYDKYGNATVFARLGEISMKLAHDPILVMPDIHTHKSESPTDMFHYICDCKTGEICDKCIEERLLCNQIPKGYESINSVALGALVDSSRELLELRKEITEYLSEDSKELQNELTTIQMFRLVMKHMRNMQ